MLKLGEVKALSLSLIIVLSVVVSEISVGIVSNSITIISDGIHALFDGIIIILMVIMLRFSRKPRDQDHTYGHGKLESIGALIGSMLLFIVATLIIREAITRFLYKEFTYIDPSSIYVVVYAIIASIIRINILRLARFNNQVIKVGLYDALADLGSSTIALISILLTTLGFLIADIIGSLIISSIILLLTSRLTYSSIMELTDAIDPELVKEVRNLVYKIEGIKECKDVRIRKVGKDLFVDMIVTLDGRLSFDKAHRLSNEIEETLKKVINANEVMVHFEPEQHKISENTIRDIAKDINGVEDVHNIIISNIEGEMSLSMHIQVARDLTLFKAHEIADRVENAIKERLGISKVIIHIEPLLPTVGSMKSVNNKDIKDIVEDILKSENIKDIVIKDIKIYSFDNIIRLDINCGMKSSLNIEEVHESITKLERLLKNRLNAIVNIHTEPI